MKSSKRPSWVTKYEEVGLPPEWADKPLEKHSDNLLEEADNSLSPVKYVNIDILELDDEPMSQFPDPPEGTTFIETVLAVFDFLKSFAKNIPQNDGDIHSLYERIKNDDRFKTEFEFPDFYRFCRQIQYNRIDKLSEYQRLQETYKNYIDSLDPEAGSKWIVEHEETKYKFLVQAEKSDVYESETKPSIYGQITGVISEDNEKGLELGEFVSVPPSDFIEKL